MMVTLKTKAPRALGLHEGMASTERRHVKKTQKIGQPYLRIFHVFVICCFFIVCLASYMSCAQKKDSVTPGFRDSRIR